MKYAITVEFEGQLVDKIVIDRFAVRAVSIGHALRKAYQIMIDRQLNGQVTSEIPVYRMTDMGFWPIQRSTSQTRYAAQGL